jgi:hypothetical protein
MSDLSDRFTPRKSAIGEIMKDLLIYHPETGTLIELSDRVYLIDADTISDETRSDLEAGSVGYAGADSLGYRLDNFNMTNLFFGY